MGNTLPWAVGERFFENHACIASDWTTFGDARVACAPKCITIRAKEVFQKVLQRLLVLKATEAVDVLEEAVHLLRLVVVGVGLLPCG